MRNEIASITKQEHWILQQLRVVAPIKTTKLWADMQKTKLEEAGIKKVKKGGTSANN